MEVMISCRELDLGVASKADRIAGKMKLTGMGVVAVGTGDTLGVHPALQERPVDIDLLLNLTVGVIEALLQKRQAMGIPDGSTEFVILRHQ